MLTSGTRPPGEKEVEMLPLLVGKSIQPETHKAFSMNKVLLTNTSQSGEYLSVPLLLSLPPRYGSCLTALSQPWCAALQARHILENTSQEIRGEAWRVSVPHVSYHQIPRRVARTGALIRAKCFQINHAGYDPTLGHQRFPAASIWSPAEKDSDMCQQSPPPAPEVHWSSSLPGCVNPPWRGLLRAELLRTPTGMNLMPNR